MPESRPLKRFDVRALVLIVVVCALVCRFYSPRTLELDLKRSLDYFWRNSGTRVKIDDRGEAVVTVTVPVGISAERRQWTYPLLDFVAARHPDRKVRAWKVNFGLEGRVMEGDTSTALIRDRAQAELNEAFGRGRVLALVAVIWPDSDSSSSYDAFEHTNRYPKNSRNHEKLEVCLLFNSAPNAAQLNMAREKMVAGLSLAASRGDTLSYLTLP